MIPFDIWISLCSIGLCATSAPVLLNRKAQSPRFWSIAIAVILSLMVPAFFLQSDFLTTITLTGQAVIWYLIAAFRPIKKANISIPWTSALPTVQEFKSTLKEIREKDAQEK